MPVYADWTWSDDSKHFIFTDKESVNYFYLTDIIPIQIRNLEGKLSIGDILMFLSLILEFTIGAYYVFLVYKSYKNERFK